MSAIRRIGFAEAAKLVPAGVVCLLSALAFHELGTQVPHEVWLAPRAHSKRPTVGALPLRIVWFSGRAFTEGIETHRVEGVKVRVYSPGKTIAERIATYSAGGLRRTTHRWGAGLKASARRKKPTRFGEAEAARQKSLRLLAASKRNVASALSSGS